MNRILEFVEDILSRYRVKSLPVPVEKIAQSLGAELRYEPFEAEEGHLSGMLFREADRVVIGVNSSDSLVRQRFTIAHEIGHFKLHQNPVYVDTLADIMMRNDLSGKAVDRKEIEANTFAAELLMPTKMIRQAHLEERAVLLDQFGAVPDEELVDKLSLRFDVSSQAMTFRLANLKLVRVK